MLTIYLLLQARYVCSLFAAQREMIRVATLSQKPPVTSTIFAELLKPTNDELTQVITIRDPSKRSSPLWNHLNAVAEGIPALGWVSVVRDNLLSSIDIAHDPLLPP